LPADFELATAIIPLVIWQQWHHWLTVSGGIAVGALKNIPAKDCPYDKNQVNIVSTGK